LVVGGGWGQRRISGGDERGGEGIRCPPCFMGPMKKKRSPKKRKNTTHQPSIAALKVRAPISLKVCEEEKKQKHSICENLGGIRMEKPSRDQDSNTKTPLAARGETSKRSENEKGRKTVNVSGEWEALSVARVK